MKNETQQFIEIDKPMSKMINQRWIYTKRPTSQVGSQHYQLVEEPVDERLALNEVLLKNRYLSVDPYMRIQQSAGSNWEDPHPLNSMQQGGVIAEVLSSRSNLYRPGDWVLCYSGWERYSKVHASDLSLLNNEEVPLTSALGILGMPGRTAWFGLMEAGKPKPGDTVVVSGATGAVGSLVIQYAKLAGCHVIAFAGGKQKCQWLEQTFNVERVIDYKQFETAERLRSYLIEQQIGVDVYFDNVGGMITDAVIPQINQGARIVICGQMSQYNGQLDQVELGPRFLHHLLYKRATIQGILARDFAHCHGQMYERVLPWVKSGQVHFEQSIVRGFDQMPLHLASLFERTSVGKLIVDIGE